jgi:hypothetical protein
MGFKCNNIGAGEFFGINGNIFVVNKDYKINKLKGRG